jgi:dihydrofolate reductase
MFAIVCVSENWGIGKNGDLLFHIKDDLKRFRELTLDKSVIMGRKTLESLPGGKGLPRRHNVVLTTNRDYTAENAEIIHFPVEAVFAAGEDAAVIGGEQIYRLLLPLCDKVYVTKVFAAPEADAFFPDLDADPKWQVESESEIFEEDGLRWQYVDYVPAQEEEDEEVSALLNSRSDEPMEFYPQPDLSEFSQFHGF